MEYEYKSNQFDLTNQTWNDTIPMDNDVGNRYIVHIFCYSDERRIIMMKKLLACVLAGTMVVASLTACGSTQSAEGTTEGTTESGSSETAGATE